MKRAIVAACALTACVALVGCQSSAAGQSHAAKITCPNREPVIQVSPGQLACDPDAPVYPVASNTTQAPVLSVACTLGTNPDDGFPAYQATFTNPGPSDIPVHSWTVNFYDSQGDTISQVSTATGDPGTTILIQAGETRSVWEDTYGNEADSSVTSCQVISWSAS